MIGVHPYLLNDYARDRQRELLAEAEQASLVRAARSGSNKARKQPSVRLRVVLSVAVRSTWNFLF